ncbi:OmpA family protein [Oceanicoccus sp. KOV_DT_Chl]|uniref:flagellar protein MotY n=1 Tax=Oceanicoccus sp. KOV_DT_Chl TaxID=1904639 RepID=UPI000C7CEB3E|nr:OmpA family protein [Oceanicoccus sp. KOV_DT_Chl]
MGSIVFRLSVLLLVTQWAVTVQATRYGPSLNEAEWRLELSPFECRMWQPIPYFGDAVFSNRAGEEQTFYLAPVRKQMQSGEAQLVSEPPVWDESRRRVDMGKVTVNKSGKPVAVGKQRAYQLLNELYVGMSPVLTRSSWYAENEEIELFMSSVNFRKAYRQYQDCLASLLPVNFDQINRSRIRFQTAKYELTAATKTQLDHVVMYVKADPSVTGFYIDGHTDDVGRRLYNLDLSKRRAEAVTGYLVASGVDEAMITTRYHGEQYPAVKNNSAANRAENRRVTIRLEREGF